MTSQSPEVKALASFTFAPATFSKRFARDLASMSPDVELTVRQERCLFRLLYIFRRQVPADIAAEAIRRKVDHKWVPDPSLGEVVGLGSSPRFRCETCRNLLHSARERNAPCPGPPEPKTQPKKESHGRRAHSPLLESPIVAPTFPLLEESA